MFSFTPGLSASANNVSETQLFASGVLPSLTGNLSSLRALKLVSRTTYWFRCNHGCLIFALLDGCHGLEVSKVLAKTRNTRLGVVPDLANTVISE